LVHDGPAAFKAAVIGWLVPRQASRRIIEAVAKCPGGQFTYGARLVLSAFGAGFTRGSFCFRWAIA
jgi:3-oxoacyl-[acyl-carrier-protein] synthase III